MTKGSDAVGKAMASVAQVGKAVAAYQAAREAKRERSDAEPKPKRADINLELPARAQHGGFINRPTEHAGIVGRVSQPPIDRLFVRKTISARMHSAAQRLRTDFEIGEMGAQDIDSDLPPGVRGGGGCASPSDRRIDALTAYKTACRAIGRHLAAVVVPVVCHENDVAACAAATRENAQEVMGVLKAGLKTLADHYRLLGADYVAQELDTTNSRAA